jgi:hypothetical protein
MEFSSLVVKNQFDLWPKISKGFKNWSYQKKQARKGFRLISVSQKFSDFFCEFFGIF